MVSDVSQLVGGHREVCGHLFELFITQLASYARERAPHCREPRVAGTLSDAKGRVAHTKARVAAFFLVRFRTSPVLLEKESEVSARLGEVIGIHGSKRVVALAGVVKGVNQLDEKGLTADVIEEWFFHADTLIVSPTMDCLVVDQRAGVAQW